MMHIHMVSTQEGNAALLNRTKPNVASFGSNVKMRESGTNSPDTA